jgi:LDH2 family malate/lactate/ureidoglycolate dehydrogenase
MRLEIARARTLLEGVMRKHGHDAEQAAIIADHLLDCELRGLRQGGLARAISITERLARTASPARPIRVERETPLGARLDGGDQIGYLVARQATELAIAKARASGIAAVAAHNTWYTGMLSYYAERAVAQGLVAMIASNASAWVAPHGATEGRFGTNPMCFGFPSAGTPVIWDIGTSVIIHADAMLARRLGQPLAPGVAYDAEGRPTTDPTAALAGALVAWGGAKGSGLGLVVQLLGILAGSSTIPEELARFGFLVVLLDPQLLGAEDFPRQVAEYVAWVHSARPADPALPVRVPFERSAREREQRLREGFVEVPEVIHAALVELAGRAAA